MGFRNLVLDSASLFEVQFNFFCELMKIVFKLNGSVPIAT